MKQMKALYANEPMMNRSDGYPSARVEERDSNVAGVNFAQRIIEVVAVPYNEPATIQYRGELWEESFDPAAFIGIETRQKLVRVNRDHDKRRTVGKIVSYSPSRTEGLVAEVRIAQTPLGDETLALADEEALGASVGFTVPGSGQELDRRSHARRIKRAFLDHLALTADEAYSGARVLNVRDGIGPVNVANLPRLVTPDLDELLQWRRSWVDPRQGH